MQTKLGHTYADIITGFSGVCIGRAEYLTGCNQSLLQPKGSDPNKRPDSEWFDEQRLEEQPNNAVVTLDNGKTPGCDKPAPKC